MGGAERVLWNTLSYWQKNKANSICTVLLPGVGLFADFLQSQEIDCFLFDMDNKLSRLGDSTVRKENLLNRFLNLLIAIPSVYRAVRQLRKLILKGDPDFILANGFKAQILGALAAPKGLPVTWFIQDFVCNRSLVSKILPRVWNKNIQIIADSQAVAADVARLIPKSLIAIWYNTVDLDKFQPKKTKNSFLDEIAGFPLPWNGLRIGLVATFAKWKGHKIFLQAAKIVLEKTNAPVRFYVVGGAIYQSKNSQWSIEELKQESELLGVNNCVGFIGFQQDMAKVYNALDVVVHASTDPEPFGQVIIEGMACGKTVVVAAHGGAAEIGTSGLDCLQHLPGDANSLAECINYLIENEKVRENIGNEARATVVRSFGMDSIDKRWESLFKSLELPC
jgi:glycosyltransferase involved in cell wall biosynthesis